MLDKAGCRRMEPKLTQQRQKLATTVKLLAQLYDALSQSKRLAGKVQHSNLFNIQPIHIGRQVTGERERELLPAIFKMGIRWQQQ